MSPEAPDYSFEVAWNGDEWYSQCDIGTPSSIVGIGYGGTPDEAMKECVESMEDNLHGMAMMVSGGANLGNDSQLQFNALRDYFGKRGEIT